VLGNPGGHPASAGWQNLSWQNLSWQDLNVPEYYHAEFQRPEFEPFHEIYIWHHISVHVPSDYRDIFHLANNSLHSILKYARQLYRYRMAPAVRNIPKQEWAGHKDAIHDLYHIQKLPLHSLRGDPSVQQIMRGERNFDAR